jgi:hypothetical protein
VRLPDDNRVAISLYAGRIGFPSRISIVSMTRACESPDLVQVPGRQSVTLAVIQYRQSHGCGYRLNRHQSVEVETFSWQSGQRSAAASLMWLARWVVFTVMTAAVVTAAVVTAAVVTEAVVTAAVVATAVMTAVSMICHPFSPSSDYREAFFFLREVAPHCG